MNTVLPGSRTGTICKTCQHAGREGEFFLVDPAARGLESDPEPAIFKACERYHGLRTVAHDVLRTQVETGTEVCGSVKEVRKAVRETRCIVIEAAAKCGLAVLAV